MTAVSLSRTVSFMCWKVLDHSALSLDLSLCDFHVLSHFRQVLKVDSFGLDGNIKAAVVQGKQQPKR
jgi:hypothetical protein